MISLPGASGKRLRANDYLYNRQIPNFFFHVSMAYALLRHAGVPIGKADYPAICPSSRAERQSSTIAESSSTQKSKLRTTPDALGT